MVLSLRGSSIPLEEPLISEEKLPVFDGIEGYWWTICAGQFWNARGTPKSQRLLEAENAFTGQALNWFRLWRQRNPNADWVTFEIAFLHRYQLNFRHVLPEISWNEVSDLDLVMEEIKACRQSFQQQLDLQRQQQREEDINITEATSTPNFQESTDKQATPESHQPHVEQSESTIPKQCQHNKIKINNNVEQIAYQKNKEQAEEELDMQDALPDALPDLSIGMDSSSEGDSDLSEIESKQLEWALIFVKGFEVQSDSSSGDLRSLDQSTTSSVEKEEGKRSCSEAPQVHGGWRGHRLAAVGGAAWNPAAQAVVEDGAWRRIRGHRGGETPWLLRRWWFSKGASAMLDGGTFVAGQPATVAALPWVCQRSFWNGTRANARLDGQELGPPFLGLAQFGQRKAQVRAICWQAHEKQSLNSTGQIQSCFQGRRGSFTMGQAQIDSRSGDKRVYWLMTGGLKFKQWDPGDFIFVSSRIKKMLLGLIVSKL